MNRWLTILVLNRRLSFPVGLGLVVIMAYSNIKGQSVPDFGDVHPIVQRMIDDRSKSLEILRATRFLPFGYDSTTYETERGTVTTFYLSPTEHYSFHKGKLTDINFKKYGLPFESLDSLDMYGLDRVFAKFGPTNDRLPSSHGHFSTIFLYPKYGLAFHGDKFANYYDFVEVFSPTTFRGYKRRLWQDPDRYVRAAEKLARMNRRHERH